MNGSNTGSLLHVVSVNPGQLTAHAVKQLRTSLISPGKRFISIRNLVIHQIHCFWKKRGINIDIHPFFKFILGQICLYGAAFRPAFTHVG